MFVASTRTDSCLDSLSRNDFCTLASRKNCPHESIVRGPSVPNSPGLAFTSAFTADVPSVNTVEPGVPAGTLIAIALRVQNEEKSAVLPTIGFWETRPGSLHWGSR